MMANQRSFISTTFINVSESVLSWYHIIFFGFTVTLLPNIGNICMYILGVQDGCLKVHGFNMTSCRMMTFIS